MSASEQLSTVAILLHDQPSSTTKATYIQPAATCLGSIIWFHYSDTSHPICFLSGLLGSEPTAGQFPVAVHSTAMPIHFFSFPSKIRNKIYKEALVLSEPIILWVRQPYGGIYGLALPRNSRECGPLRLCPAILLANKRAHWEASPLLYSRNCVRLSLRPVRHVPR
jgi:hypothetical protein